MTEKWEKLLDYRVVSMMEIDVRASPSISKCSKNTVTGILNARFQGPTVGLDSSINGMSKKKRTP